VTGLQRRLTDAELVTLAAMQALLGYTSGSRRVRDAATGESHRSFCVLSWLGSIAAAARARRRTLTRVASRVIIRSWLDLGGPLDNQPTGQLGGLVEHFGFVVQPPAVRNPP